EKPISELIEEFLTLSRINYIPRRAETKNDFPDLEVKINGIKYALEHKAGTCNIKGDLKHSAANDMGTINAYPEKLENYGDNIYCTFVKYSVLMNDTIRIEDIYFDKIYKFIGRGSGFNNQLQYREKDGNLRPKTWADMANNRNYFSTFSQFQEALVATAQYRSERIALKHIEGLERDSLERIRDHINTLLNR
ncbi:MAG: hypothetical protein IJB32_05205, partial [Clostridia bacterium]|nr:hypothetical protein [Clostridia bacterium]